MLQYEEPDTAVNKHLGAGVANGEGSSSSGNGNARPRDGSASASNSASSSNTSVIMSSEEDSVHIQTIEQAMTRLKQLDQDKNTDEWEKVMHHHRDVTVYVRKSVVNVAGKQKKVPLFRG